MCAGLRVRMCHTAAIPLSRALAEVRPWHALPCNSLTIHLKPLGILCRQNPNFVFAIERWHKEQLRFRE